MSVGPTHLGELERLLSCEEGLDHLRVKMSGDFITIYSGEGVDEAKHARLTQIGGANWGLSLSHHTGRWERVPFVGSMQQLVATLVRDFSFHLETW